MESGHFIEKCRVCDKVISQCRCPSKDKEIRWSLCEEHKGTPLSPIGTPIEISTIESTHRPADSCDYAGPPPLPAPRFVDELEALINRHSIENGSNTPDFILAEYLTDCLAAFDKATRDREKWFGKGLRIGGHTVTISDGS